MQRTILIFGERYNFTIEKSKQFRAKQSSTQEKELSGKGPAIKNLEHSPLGRGLIAQTGIAGKQYRGLNKVYGFDKKEGDNENNRTDKKYKNSNIVYDRKHTFYKYRHIEKNAILSFKWKY